MYCCNTDVGDAVQQVKNGLEQEGLTGLGDDVRTDQSTNTERVAIRRRREFRGQNIFLPKVLHRDGGDWVELDYQRHILPGIEWSAIQAPDPQSVLPESVRIQTASVDVGDSQPVYLAERELDIDRTVTTSYFARRLSDIVPNPWQAAAPCAGYGSNNSGTRARVKTESITSAPIRRSLCAKRKAITWWHRVAARQRSEYYLRGWKRERIWPDFIAMAGQTEGKPHLLVFETKGGHLDNPDTGYKRARVRDA